MAAALSYLDVRYIIIIMIMSWLQVCWGGGDEGEYVIVYNVYIVVSESIVNEGASSRKGTIVHTGRV